MNLFSIVDLIRLLKYKDEQTVVTDEEDGIFMAEEEYRRKLILGIFTPDGIVLILSGVAIAALLMYIFYISLRNF